MSNAIPASPRIRAPKLTGSESWLNPEGTCKTTTEEIAALGVPPKVQLAIMFMRALPYEEYLKSSHWQTVRRDVFIAQDGKCGTCGNGVIRDTHHRAGRYRRKGFERDEDVIGVCRPCHEVLHNSIAARMREEGRHL